MSKWFVNKKKILMIPIDLAMRIGFNEAVVLNQLNYWLENDGAGVEVDGHKWIYNTYTEWRDGRKDANGKQVQEPNFPFWSTKTIQRIFASLENSGLVISRQFDAKTWDHGKYYRIDYEKMDALEAVDDLDKLS